MRKLIFWATVVSGVAAAYLMFRRGESLDAIAEQATQRPFGALADELRRG
jgi:hypothetical protein